MRRQVHTNQALSGDSHLSLRPSPHNCGARTSRGRLLYGQAADPREQDLSRAAGFLGACLSRAQHRARRSPRAANPGPEASANRARITPSLRTSPIWGRKKSLICSMCSGPPGYYNLNNRQAGRTLNLPPSRAARLFCCPMDQGPFSFDPSYARPLLLIAELGTSPDSPSCPTRLFSEHMAARIGVSLKDSTMEINNV